MTRTKRMDQMAEDHASAVNDVQRLWSAQAIYLSRMIEEHYRDGRLGFSDDGLDYLYSATELLQRLTSSYMDLDDPRSTLDYIRDNKNDFATDGFAPELWTYFRMDEED